MTSHDYANMLRGLSELLESKPEFPLPPSWNAETVSIFISINYWSYKEEFLAAAKALGSFSKRYTDEKLIISAPANGGVELRLDVDRKAVCRIVKPSQPAEYECDPLLTPEEESAL